MNCPSCKRPLPKPRYRCGVWVKPYYSDQPRQCSKLVSKAGNNCKHHRMKK